MLIHSPHGMVSPRHFYTNISHLKKSPSSLYEPWERFKELQWECPHHGILDWLLVQTFYNDLQQPMKMSIDVTTRAAFMAKLINEAKQLLEDIASNNYHWASEKGYPKKGERHEINAFIMVASKGDALFRKVDQLETPHSYGSTASGSFRKVNLCEVCGVQGKSGNECHLDHSFQDLTIGQANVLHNFYNRP